MCVKIGSKEYKTHLNYKTLFDRFSSLEICETTNLGTLKFLKYGATW